MTVIKAPFNFVPLSRSVYFPEWADGISQDIPFEDGKSGVLNVTVTARTPVYVRNGHTKEEADSFKKTCKEVFDEAKKICGSDADLHPEVLNGKYIELLKKRLEKAPEAAALFSHVSAKAFIPATSFKGAVRNVLEIMSFGKIRVDQSAKFAQREWDNKDLYTLKGHQGEVRCGWLRECGSDYRLFDCGKPLRIAQQRIDEYARQELDGYGREQSFQYNFAKGSKVNLNKEQKLRGITYDPKTAEYKYALLDKVRLEDLNFSEDEEYSNDFGRKAVKVDGKGNIRGTIVCTGQPGPCKWERPKTMDPSAGKFYEFVFGDGSDALSFDISEDEFKHFRFIYDGQWAFVNKQLEGSKGIPVFFRVEGNRIKDWGLAYLYKLPYDNSPHDLLEKGHFKQHSDSRLDLAQCIFGCADNEKSLKGRVQFSNLFADSDVEAGDLTTVVLNSPKASYYPIYIRQNGEKGVIQGKYLTYNDGELAGWKRYPVRKVAKGTALNNVDMDTVLLPVRENTVFKGKIRFHNLKEVELGALLSALTFHGNQTECYHQLGQGKPYGFGKVSVECSFEDPSLETQKNSLMAKFETAVCEGLKIRSWISDPSVLELFAMAHDEVVADDVLFRYMKMGMEKGANEFIEAKNKDHREFLDFYRVLKGSSFVPVSRMEEYRKEMEVLEAEKKSRDLLLRSGQLEGCLKKIEEFDVMDYKADLARGMELLEQLEKEIDLIDIRNMDAGLLERRGTMLAMLRRHIGTLASWSHSAVGLSDFLKETNNIGTILGKVKKWMETNDFTDEAKCELKDKLVSLYHDLKPGDRKKWSRPKSWKDLEKLLGEEETKAFLERLLDK